MKKLMLTLSLLPIFIHADGDYSMEDANNAAQAATPYIEYHNRMAVFAPFHQVYERTETHAFYVGVEGWRVPVFFNNKLDAAFETELRFGYNLFYNGRDHLTPFGGGGILQNYKKHHHKHHKHHFLPGIGYGVLGFLYDHEFDSVVNLGVNFKGFIGGGINKKHHDWGNPVLGFDIAVPLTFRFGRKRHWDYRFEPFNIYLQGRHENLNIFGFRSTVGYRF